jgi:hypothetical protein
MEALGQVETQSRGGGERIPLHVLHLKGEISATPSSLDVSIGFVSTTVDPVEDALQVVEGRVRSSVGQGSVSSFPSPAEPVPKRFEAPAAGVPGRHRRIQGRRGGFRVSSGPSRPHASDGDPIEVREAPKGGAAPTSRPLAEHEGGGQVDHVDRTIVRDQHVAMVKIAERDASVVKRLDEFLQAIEQAVIEAPAGHPSKWGRIDILQCEPERTYTAEKSREAGKPGGGAIRPFLASQKKTADRVPEDCGARTVVLDGYIHPVQAID